MSWWLAGLVALALWLVAAVVCAVVIGPLVGRAADASRSLDGPPDPPTVCPRCQSTYTPTAAERDAFPGELCGTCRRETKRRRGP